MKKTILFLFFTLVFTGVISFVFFSPQATAQRPCEKEVLGCFEVTGSIFKGDSILEYINKDKTPLIRTVSTAYNYGIITVILGSIISVVAGGIVYITAGSSKRVDLAKALISSALIALVLALASYLILNTINPQFTSPAADPVAPKL